MRQVDGLREDDVKAIVSIRDGISRSNLTSSPVSLPLTFTVIARLDRAIQ